MTIMQLKFCKVFVGRIVVGASGGRKSGKIEKPNNVFLLYLYFDCICIMPLLLCTVEVGRTRSAVLGGVEEIRGH